MLRSLVGSEMCIRDSVIIVVVIIIFVIFFVVVLLLVVVVVLDVGRSDRYWYPRSALDSGYPKTAQTAPGLAGTRNGSVLKRVMKGN